MLFQCWYTVYDAGPTLYYHWVKLCLLGSEEVDTLRSCLYYPNPATNAGFIGPALQTLGQHEASIGSMSATLDRH